MSPGNAGREAGERARAAMEAVPAWAGTVWEQGHAPGVGGDCPSEREQVMVFTFYIYIYIS